jgi:flagellum-specific peptidoglycan hydrolase FlgJ
VFPHDVQAIRTVITAGDALDAIAEAYESQVGGEIPSRLLLALGAQSALETARWRSMWCYNMGNLRGHGPDGATMDIPGANEIIDGKAVLVERGFAAYPNRIAGAKAYVRYLCVATRPPAPNRYQAAIDAATRGDLAGFVHGLKENGYFTAGEVGYLRAELSEENWLEKLPEAHAWVSEAV